jgi:competence protein ComGC
MDNPASYNPASYPPPPPPPQVPRREGMAIASMVIGIISLLTCGGACVGALLALVFGIIAWTRASRDPVTFGGKGMAIAGIVMSVVSVAGGSVVALITIPNKQKSQQAAHEAAAHSYVRTIETAEATYQLTKGQGSFGDLSELGEAGNIDSTLASGVKAGYKFEVKPFTGPHGQAMFDVTAVPISTGAFGTGNRSYGGNENYVIFEAEGAVKLTGTPSNRVPAGAVVVF